MFNLSESNVTAWFVNDVILCKHCAIPKRPIALPSPGFYPEISGFFEAVGIFWGFLFEKVNLGIFLGFFRKGSSKFRNGFFCKID